MATLQDNWTELSARIRSFVGRRINDPHAADDIAQDVMLKMQTQMDSLPAEDKLPRWLFAVARNAITDYYRSRAVRNHADITSVDPAADTDEADQLAAIQSITPCLLRMVDQLPEPYRDAMMLADFDGVGQQEIADRLGISLSGAKSRVQRGRQQLREMVADCCHLERDGRGNVFDYETTDRSARYCGDDKGKAQCRP